MILLKYDKDSAGLIIEFIKLQVLSLRPWRKLPVTPNNNKNSIFSETVVPMRYACESSDEDISDQGMLTLRLFWLLHNLYKDHCINFFTVNKIKYPTKSNLGEKRLIYTLRGMGHHWGEGMAEEHEVAGHSVYVV